MAAPKPIEEKEQKEDWLITYADAITLLMAFFVMLLTFAEYDIPAFEEAAAAIKENLTGRESTSPIQLLRIDVNDVVFNMQADQVVKVETDDKGIVIELASKAFYKPGSADIREEALPVLEKMSQTLLAPRYLFYTIEIEGHTDDDPISTPRYPSNWELSASRATGIIRFLISQGFDATRMRATGYADTKPKAPNYAPDGSPIPENKSANRRTGIRVYPMSLAKKKAYEEVLAKREEMELEKKAAESGGTQALPPLEQKK
ncbi:MAG: OmpA family protein [Rhodospirillales bacterium]|nr:OmpA family protein [Alphaproteobacteria bacterium]MBL6948517.1 OmpA family protein [Rhodospirillales bacterium]